MATAKQCDRCGKFYTFDCDTPKTINVKTHIGGLCRSIYVDDHRYAIDLCEECLKELARWWKK